jgi:hypothetical protein
MEVAWPYKALVKFELSPLAGIEAALARLRLDQDDTETGDDITLAAHKILADWTGPETTWNEREAGTAWSTAGMGPGTDYEAAAQDTVVVGENGWHEWTVTGAVNDGIAGPNHGLVIVYVGDTGWWGHFTAADHPSGYGPELYVEYSEGGPATAGGLSGMNGAELMVRNSTGVEGL